MARWNIAMRPFSCRRCTGVIGQGEAFRESNRIPRAGYCEDCSIAIDGETAPAAIRPRDFLEQLRDDIQKAAPKRESGFSGFDRTVVAGQVRSNILTHRKASVTSVDTQARQASFDPRGQNYRRRHGVVEAIRATTETDWRHRRTGERE